MKKLFTLILLFASFRMQAQLCLPNSNSLVFNGTSSMVAIPSQNNLNTTTGVTVEAWIKAAAWSANSWQNSIFCKHSGFGAWGLSGYALRAGANGTLSFVIGGDSAGAGTSIKWKEIQSQSNTLPLNTWTHVAATFDGMYLKIYKNGVLLKDSAFTGTINPSQFPAKIGSFSDSLALASGTANRFWNGSLDEIRVWNRALTQTEIADSMNVQITPSAQSGLIGYWQFNEGSGTTINDVTSNANNGTSTSTTWSTSVPFNTAPPVPVIIFTGTQLYVTNSCPNYQWYLDGNIIPGATSQVYNPTVNGTYTVVDTNAYCTNTSAPFLLTTLSVNENELSQLVSLSPNPVTDLLSIRISNGAFNKVVITDVEGRIVYEQTELNDAMVIPFDGIADGIYIARLSGQSGTVTKRFVVR